MKILLVEDDENKRQRILQTVRSRFPGAVVVEARSLTTAEDALDESGVELVILDMSMPTFDITPEEDGGSFEATGGQELLRYIKRYRFKAPVVVVTQFSTFGKGKDARTLAQLHQQLKEEYGAAYLGTVYYDTASEDWKEQLIAAADGVLGNRRRGESDLG
jgi:DNA-binding NarL/FixJ family response regulator